MKNKTKLCGQEGFNQFYSELFGSRWEALKESFFQENQYSSAFFRHDFRGQ